MKIKIAILTALITMTSATSAAMGPYLVWINLAQNPGTANLQIRSYISSQGTACWDKPTSLLFIRDKPQALSDELVVRALVNGDEAAKDKLNSILKTPFGADAIGGFDGIMLYADKPSPRLYSMGIGDRTVKAADVGQGAGKESLEARFCELIPVAKRKIPLRNQVRIRITR